ncbi:MAG: hypothetical protein JJU29_01790 [Verrucomicrobia bacterium]|nr:hypothetical protein [Verrucomicrobiota bacterium]MCH8510965.1 hypothetical protein [Kiritimatiellia bacterium]
MEYEGVIQREGRPVRFSCLKQDIRDSVCRLTGDSCPVDCCDYLAEIRTHPHAIHHPEALIEDLLRKRDGWNRAAREHRLQVAWRECYLGVDRIRAAVAGRRLKPIYTLADGRLLRFPVRSNALRGGGVHINVSGLSAQAAQRVFEELHHALSPKYNRNFRSKYRSLPLLRPKPFGMEYLSLGCDESVGTLAEFAAEVMDNMRRSIVRLQGRN